MGLLASMVSASLAFVVFQGLFKISQSNVIDADAGNVTVCVDAIGSPVECKTDPDCRNATVPPRDFRGFVAPAGTAGQQGCTCYRFGNELSYCVKVPPEQDYDYSMY
uniref:Putative secreted protein n=1 Tax=Amblyomma cajennense TaxID=34607 RepID=A0A023FBR2_AMBCJ